MMVLARFKVVAAACAAVCVLIAGWLSLSLAGPNGNEVLPSDLPASGEKKDQPDILPKEEDGEVRCRLSADKKTWGAGEVPTLRCEIENKGKLSRPVHLKEGFHMIEVDGKVYAWAGGSISSVTEPFPPGSKAEIRFILKDENWAPLDEKEARRIETERLRLKAGKHTVRVRLNAGTISIRPLLDLTVGPPVRVWSNAVDIQVEDGDKSAPKADGGGLTPAEAAALRDRLLEAAKTNKPLIITPKVGIGPVRFGMSAKEVQAALGKPFRTTGRAQEYQHLGLAVVMDKQDRVAAILLGAWCEPSDILLDVFKGGTEAGVRLRAERGQVLKAYGEPSVTSKVGPAETDFEVLRYDNLWAEFAFRKGKLVHITLRRPLDKEGEK
jgi:hypothetical protein